MNATEANVSQIKALIREVVEGIPAGKVFDAHTIISVLWGYKERRKILDDYQAETPANKVHSQLSVYIRELSNEGMIEEFNPKYERAYECKCWKKITPSKK